jgi:ketosteroid isomerase-like protein
MSEQSATSDLAEQMRQSLEAGELDAAISYFALDGVWESSPNGVGVFEGAATIRRFFEDWARAYEELKFVLEELRDVGNGVVFPLVRQEARPVGSSGYIRQRDGLVWVWVGGRCASVTVYPETEIDEGRAAAERLAQERG